MPTVWITANNTHATIRSERLVVEPVSLPSELKTQRSIPLHDIDLVVLGASSSFSSHLTHKLMERKVPILLLDRIGHVRGQFFPYTPPRGSTRIAQYKKSLEADFHSRVAAPLIAAKLYNQRRSLQRLGNSRESSSILAAFNKRCGHQIDILESPHVSTQPISRLMGIEGSTSAEFYHLWSHFLPDNFPFERRSRRPPHNPVNACISFIASVLYYEMLAACFATGLDPSIGHLHVTSDDRWSLALDFIEPLRPVVVEALTMDLFSRHILDTSHFDTLDNGGIHLNIVGRRKLILQYEKRLERYFQSEHLGHRTTLRNVLRKIPAYYKKHLLSGKPFLPFRMN